MFKYDYKLSICLIIAIPGFYLTNNLKLFDSKTCILCNDISYFDVKNI